MKDQASSVVVGLTLIEELFYLCRADHSMSQYAQPLGCKVVEHLRAGEDIPVDLTEEINALCDPTNG